MTEHAPGAGSSDRYDAVLRALYDVTAPPPAEPDRRVRFEIERDRRILDVARLLSAGWPRTCYFERARTGDELIFGVAALIPELRHSAPTIRHAVEQAAHAWIERRGDRLSRALFSFEHARSGGERCTRPPTETELGELRARGVTEARVLDVDFDLLAFIGSLDFLSARSAPATFVRDLKPTGGPQAVAFYARGGRVVAAPLRSPERPTSS
ncbi:hypothetical protein [Sorangium sp. So ce542]|uniref:hypothetical protein n=1 Tax=Sorangium sp. So ce542 TaxID=3133316 RepID=UPI003F5F6856